MSRGPAEDQLFKYKNALKVCARQKRFPEKGNTFLINFSFVGFQNSNIHFSRNYVLIMHCVANCCQHLAIHLYIRCALSVRWVVMKSILDSLAIIILIERVHIQIFNWQQKCLFMFFRHVSLVRPFRQLETVKFERIFVC